MSEDSLVPSSGNGASAALHAGKRNRPLLTTRKVIEMETTDIACGGFADWVNAAVVALSLRRRYGLGRVHQMGGALVRIRPAASGADARIEPLSEDSLRVCLSDVCDFDDVRANAKGTATHRVVPPPVEILRSLLNLEKYSRKQFPPLELLAASPILGVDGQLLSRRGYYRKEKLRLEPNIEIPPVSTRPTKAEVKDAVSLLQDEFLGDFPFADNASRAHAMSAILVPLVRRMIGGPTPLHLSLASGPGIGKSLLISALTTIATGQPAVPQPMRDSEEEVSKSILALLLTGPAYVFYDNVVSLDSATLSLAIASPNCRYGGRLLGQTKWLEPPALACWVASGNNVKLTREMTRRTAVIRLALDLERPWTRANFRHPALIKWGMENRASLLHSALTIVSGWVAAGMPQGVESLGGFESWCATIGGILSFAEVPGFLANRDELLVADEELLRWTALTAAWWRQHDTAVVGIEDLYRIISMNGELEVAFAAVVGQGADKTQKQRLGQALKAVAGRVFGNHRLEVLAATARGFPLYRLVAVAGEPREPGSDDDRGDPPPALAQTFIPF